MFVLIPTANGHSCVRLEHIIAVEDRADGTTNVLYKPSAGANAANMTTTAKAAELFEQFNKANQGASQRSE